jgi:methionyl-tRNA synthetase
MDMTAINGFPLWLIILITLWSIPWKGVALWKAAQRSDKRWFVLLLLVNTLGILDIVYIRFVSKKYTVETVESK